MTEKKSQRYTSGLKVLAFDIETSPSMVYTFSLFKPYLSPEHIIEPSRMICWSAQWANHPDPSQHGGRTVQFQSEYHSSRQQMLQELHDLISEADVVITYNGKKFDWPWIVGEFIAEGFPPLPPVQHIDLYQVIRRNSRFLSNKLDYVAGRLLDKRKVPHQGLELWKGCLAGDEKSWKVMRRYAKQDTALLPKLWNLVRPFTRGANAVHAGIPDGCPSCGSVERQSRGYYRTKASVYKRYRCKDCGHWYRTATREQPTHTRYL